MDDANNQKIRDSKQKNSNFRVSIKAKLIESKTYSRDVIISASNTHFIVQTRVDANQYNEYSWFLLKKIELKDKNLNLQFLQTNFQFKSENISKIYKVILDILPRILKTSELLNIGLILSPNHPKSNCNSAILRLQQRIRIKNSYNIVDCYPTIIKVLQTSQNTIDLADLSSDQNCIELFTDIIPLIPNITSLTINNVERDELFHAFDLGKDTGSLEHISFKGMISPYFERFLRHLQNNKFSKITSFSFQDTKLTDKHLQILLQYAKTSKLTSLSFTNAIQQNSMTYFFFTFLNDRYLSNLIELQLNSLQNLNFYSLFPSISNITFLSLENCSLDVATFLSRSVKSKLPNCTSINLSYNKCKELGYFDLEFPPKLTNLLLNGVEWGENSLLSFFKSIDIIFDGNLRISFSNTKCSQTEWSNVFQYLPSVHPNLFVSLIWDHNPISGKFIEFLSNQKFLQFLSMSHCLSETDSSLYQFFSCFSNMKNLSHLILKGDKNFHLGKTVEMLFKTLETSGKSLDYLDISNSFCGDEGIEMISKFLNSNFSPKIFVFDGTKPTNLEPFLSLLLGYLNSNCASSVSFPLSDLEKLKNDGKIKMQQFNEILDLFRTSEGDGGSAFDSLFFIYYEDERFDEKFPRYVNASYLTESKQDKNTPKRLFEMSKNQNYQTKPKNTSVTVSISRSQPKFDKISDFTSMASESTFAPSSRAVGAPTVAFSVSNNSTNIGDGDQNKTLSDNEQNQIHEPLKPPPEKGGSPRRSIRHVSTANVEFRLDITSSSSSASSPKNLRNSKSMNSNVLLAKNGDDSDALVTKDFDISTSDDDDFREEVVTKESRHLRQTLMNSRYQKKELDDDFDWKFPLERVETMYKGSWTQSQQRFSIVESMKFLSKIPHNHYPN